MAFGAVLTAFTLLKININNKKNREKDNARVCRSFCYPCIMKLITESRGTESKKKC